MQYLELLIAALFDSRKSIFLDAEQPWKWIWNLYHVQFSICG